MSILEVRQLCKSYEKFQLKDVSFELEPGTINGFIGEIRFWGKAITDA